MNLTFSGILAVTVLVAGTAAAQESVVGEDDDFMPAVDTSSIEPAVDTGTESVDREDEIDALEPGVSGDVLVSEVQQRPAGGVMDELDLGRTEITGNQELPTVLYIVPWQKSDPGDLMGRPANTLLDEVLAPVDRGEFTRQVDYYDDLFDSAEEQ